MIRPLVLACMALLSSSVAAEPLGTVFTYQGQLADNGQPANDLYDFQFCLFDSLAGGSSLGCAPLTDTDDLPVEAGIFTAPLDFGSAAFAGEKRFLEVKVRLGSSSGAFETLTPRQPITAAPESLHTRTAPWSGLTGIPPGFQDGTDNEGVTSITAGGGLTTGGGPITTTGSLGILAGGVGTAEINSAQVQRRVSACGAGTAIRVVNEDGSVACEVDDVGAGTVTSVAAGSGLTTGPGGPITGAGTIAISPKGVGEAEIDTAQVQARVGDGCIAGASIRVVNEDGSVLCEADDVGAGTVTSVAAGTGLTTGVDPITSSGTIAIADGGVGAQQVKPNEIQRRLAQSCAEGSFLRGIGELGEPECGPAWSVVADTVLDSGNLARVSLALDTANVPAISYSRNTDLRFIKCADPSCSAPPIIRTLASGVSPAFVSIAVRSDNLPVIAYADSANALKLLVCATPDCASIQFTQTFLAGSVTGARGGSLALRAGDIPSVAFITASTQLRLLECISADCGAFSSTPVLATGNPERPSLAVGPDNQALVSYHDLANFDLRVAKCAGVLCGAPMDVLVDAGATTGAGSSLAFDSMGIPSISYRAGTTIKLAKCDLSDCSTGATQMVVLDATAAAPASQLTSLALAGSSNPIVAFRRSASSGRAALVKCLALECNGPISSTLINSAAGVFESMDLAVDSNQLPVLAYATSGGTPTLRIAKCSSGTCQ